MEVSVLKEEVTTKKALSRYTASSMKFHLPGWRCAGFFNLAGWGVGRGDKLGVLTWGTFVGFWTQVTKLRMTILYMTIDHQNVSEDVVQLVTNNKHIRFKIVVNLDIDI